MIGGWKKKLWPKDYTYVRLYVSDTYDTSKQFLCIRGWRGMKIGWGMHNWLLHFDSYYAFGIEGKKKKKWEWIRPVTVTRLYLCRFSHCANSPTGFKLKKTPLSDSNSKGLRDTKACTRIAMGNDIFCVFFTLCI